MYKQQFTVPEKFEFYISTVYDVKNTADIEGSLLPQLTLLNRIILH